MGSSPHSERPTERRPAEPPPTHRRAGTRLRALAAVTLVSAGLALLALGNGATSSATHLGLRPCSSLRTRTLSVTHVMSNFGCSHTHSTLRDLLRRGLRGLPKPTIRAGRWGCGQAGANHICSQYSSTQSIPKRIVFRARRR
jgi:hypothetical protein